MSPSDSSAERQRRYRERKAGRLPSVEKPACIACGIVHKKAHGDLCARCWERLTPEGRKARSERVKRSMSKKRSGPVVYTEAMASDDDALLDGVIVDTDDA